MTRAVEAAVARFGGIDILVNNASAISLTGTLDTPMKRFDLMIGVNVRGTFSARRPACRICKRGARNPHILNLSPPLNMNPRWFAPHVAYTMAKYGMSMCVLGMAEEFKQRRHRRQRAVAAHHHRHRGGADASRAREPESRRASRRSWPTPRTRS